MTNHKMKEDQRVGIGNEGKEEGFCCQNHTYMRVATVCKETLKS